MSSHLALFDVVSLTTLGEENLSTCVAGQLTSCCGIAVNTTERHAWSWQYLRGTGSGVLAVCVGVQESDMWVEPRIPTARVGREGTCNLIAL